MVKLCGLGESYVETQIADLIEAQTNPTIAPYAKTGEVHLRVTAKASDEKEAKKLIKPVIKELKNRFGANIYTTEESKSLEESIIELLMEKGLTLTTAESCYRRASGCKADKCAGGFGSIPSGFCDLLQSSEEKAAGCEEKYSENVWGGQ